MKTIDERILEDNLRMRKEYIADSSFSEVYSGQAHPDTKLREFLS